MQHKSELFLKQHIIKQFENIPNYLGLVITTKSPFVKEAVWCEARRTDLNSKGVFVTFLNNYPRAFCTYWIKSAELLLSQINVKGKS